MKLYFRLICTVCAILFSASFISWIQYKEVWKTRKLFTFQRYNSSNTQEAHSTELSKQGQKGLSPLKIIQEFARFDKHKYCDGSFIAIEHKFAILTNVLILPNKGVGRKGGENISEVLYQNEDDEYYKLQKGYFTLKCDINLVNYTFNRISHLNKWLSALELITSPDRSQERIDLYTIAVQRYEYANLYHTMTDFYNAFYLLEVFNIKAEHVQILLLDGHPYGALDNTWAALFKGFFRASDIKRPTFFPYMLWSTIGYDSPLNQHELTSVPKLEEFRNFFLRKHGISINNSVNCDNLTVLFLWRQDYLAHPRNPSGSVSRKIKNEDELVVATKQQFSKHTVLDVQIDLFEMTDQLRMVSQTDILIGMHGAGLSHTLFLPRHAGLVELYPTYWSTANVHFKSMARWRRLHYLSWQNRDTTKELENKYTVVDVNSVVTLLKNMVQKICGPN